MLTCPHSLHLHQCKVVALFMPPQEIRRMLPSDSRQQEHCGQDQQAHPATVSCITQAFAASVVAVLFLLAAQAKVCPWIHRPQQILLQILLALIRYRLLNSTFFIVLEARSAMHVMQLVKQSGSTLTALSPQWHLVSTGTPATTLMACSTTTKMLTGSELSIGVTRQAARLQPLTLPLKVNICLCRFLLAGTCVEALAVYHLLCDSGTFSQLLKQANVLCLLFSLVCATYLSGTH